MALSPKKYVSNYTNSTAQRGVEAKEIELANTNMELDMSVSTHGAAESSARSAARAPHAAPLLASNDDTGSYLQVVVEKHRRARSPAPRAPAAAQTSPRLPAASSPLAHNQGGRGDGLGGGERGVYVLPHPVLLACPTSSPLRSALQAHTYFT
ncbi:hypothetical protein PYW08_003504 [Mythimna loreyi]|uniref:Uncharacterized protein n=1 Tax=Mythimna loreyi TaxID=667449 RepID=A0ACC2QTE4_9NEOP|nr:hypothetical protein PYW08_003504 [Mythimna loreyi]